ncbi:MAG TPA: hypothetical protein VE177_05225 [Candidatus Binatus sp.]|nr:hypothetical protein [Candidatus Binatus sp.]
MEKSRRKKGFKPDKLHALLWGVFSVGGFIAAFLLPILIYINNIAYPLGLWPVGNAEPVRSFLIMSLLSTLFVFVTIGGSLFHGIFRFKTTLPELGLKKAGSVISIAGYVVIIVGLLALVYYLLALNPSPHLFQQII